MENEAGKVSWRADTLADELRERYDTRTKSLHVNDIPWLRSLNDLEAAVEGEIVDLQITNTDSLDLLGAEQMNHLESLSLRACNLTDLNRLEICHRFEKTLRALDVSENKQICTLQPIFKLAALEVLNCANTGLKSSEELFWLTRMPRLHRLDLRGLAHLAGLPDFKTRLLYAIPLFSADPELCVMFDLDDQNSGEDVNRLSCEFCKNQAEIKDGLNPFEIYQLRLDIARLERENDIEDAEVVRLQQLCDQANANHDTLTLLLSNAQTTLAGLLTPVDLQ